MPSNWATVLSPNYTITYWPLLVQHYYLDRNIPIIVRLIVSTMFGNDVEKAPERRPSSLCPSEDAAAEDPQILHLTISNTNAPPPIFDPNTFNPPDGGFTAWSQVVAVIFINCLAWGYPASFGVYQLYYEESLGLPSSQISWIGSCQTFLTFAFCAPAGRLADAGYTRETVAVGSFLAIFGTFMTSLCHEYWQIFLCQGVCTGIGLALLFMPAVTVLGSYFKAKKAFALALGAMGTGLGSIIFPATLQYLIPQVGFPWAVRCAAFVALVMIVTANIMLKPYLPPRKTGPLMEWEAFRELPFLLFVLGAFLNFYALYFGFFYVSDSGGSCCLFVALLLTRYIDKRLCAKRHWLHIRRSC